MEIRPADKTLRIKVLLALVALVVLGTVSVLAFEDWLADVGRRPAGEAKTALVAAFAWLGGTSVVGLLAVAVHFWRVGIQVRKVGQFPLPGTRVVRDTVVLHGEPALRRGRIAQAIAAALACCALGLLVVCGYLYLLITGGT